MSHVTLRGAKKEDTEFARQTHHIAYQKLVTDQWGKWDEAEQDTFFQKSWFLERIQIILSNSEPCGYVSILNEPTYIFINDLAILPQFQHQGIGTEVLNRIINDAKHRHIPVRGYVFKKNKAIELYKRLGFKEKTVLDEGVEVELAP